MSAPVYNYSADRVTPVFSVLTLTEGLADGDFCKVSYPDKMWTTKKGTDGTVVRSKNLGRMAMVEITLQMGAPANAALSAILTADYLTSTGAGVAPFRLVDLNGTSVHQGDEAWLEGEPEISYGREGSELTWTIVVADMRSFVGGAV